MTTNAVLATRALRRIRVAPRDSNPDAADQATAVQALVDMHAEWTARGLTVPALPLDARFDAGVVAMLGVRLCEEFGKAPGPVLLRDANRGERQIESGFFVASPATFDDAITHTGHNHSDGIILGQSANIYAQWAAGRSYVLRQYVINGSNVYECVGEGTSATDTTGPSGTSSSITDGTVTWTWRNVSGLVLPDDDGISGGSGDAELIEWG